MTITNVSTDDQSKYRQFLMFWCNICKNLSRNDFTIIFWKKYGFGWLYRDLFLHFPILLTDVRLYPYADNSARKWGQVGP
jgi:hypothetical protein